MMGKTKRQESNEEVMLASLEHRKSLDLRVLFQVKDKAGTWRMLRGQELIMRKIPNQGRLLSLINVAWLAMKNYLPGVE